MKLKALPAVDLVQKLAAVAAEVWPDENVELYAQTVLPGVRVQVSGPGRGLPGVAAGDSFMKVIEARRHVSATTGYVRRANDHNTSIAYGTSDGVIATITIDGKGSAGDAAARLDAVEKHFSVRATPDLVTEQGMSDVQHKALQLQAQTLAGFTNEVERLADFTARLAREDAERRRELQLGLEKDYREKADALAEEHRKKLAEVDARRQKNDDDLAKRVKEFDGRVHEFETGQARLVRRKMLARLEEVLQKSETLTLSAGTQKKRYFVHAIIIALLLAAGSLATVMGVKLFASEEPEWRFLVPMVTGTLTFFATLVYYIRWNDRWFREHAEGELAAKRYQADIVRANWLAELISERGEANAEIPPELLEAFTRNLFHGSTTLDEAEHPFEQFTALAKRAKGFKIGNVELALRSPKPDGCSRQGLALLAGLPLWQTASTK